MTDDAKWDNAASVREKLRNIARLEGIGFQQLLVRFANERFLFRLGESVHGNEFILKGATLLGVWFTVPTRPTTDVDLLGRTRLRAENLKAIFKEVCETGAGDAIRFDTSDLRTEVIRKAGGYQGIRIKFDSYLEKAKIPMQFDIGFGDSLIKEPDIRSLPTLLGHSSPTLAIYPVEAVIAEKFEAMVKLGISNSRMKDFWDLDLLLRNMEFDLADVRDSLRVTFGARETTIPATLPLALTDDFSSDDQKAAQWAAFVRKNALDGSGSLKEVVNSLAGFFEPVLRSLAMEDDSNLRWKNGSWE